ncbi:MAG: hypothetical protein H5T78_04215 [Nocardia sp.]|nr:hypothetical protein [Nocardia sp.]
MPYANSAGTVRVPACRSAWFSRVAWDIGIVAITAEPTLSILAATDTD